MVNIKRKLNKCRFDSLFIKYSSRKCRKSQLENKIIFLLYGKFFNISIVALCNSFVKSLFMMSIVPSFLVQPMFEQKSGNLPIACLAHPFSVVTVETRHCLHGPKAVRILLTRFATTLSKTWHKVLRTLSLLFVSL